jgi:uncharacterized protein YjbJ (UPF0337 family)
MSATDKIRNKIQKVTGYAKEKVGGVTGNQRLRAEGQNDQSKSNLKQAVEKLKDAFK